MKLKIELLIELEADIWGLEEGVDPQARTWFEEECLKADQLYLHSNEAGDIIGRVIQVKHEFI